MREIDVKEMDYVTFMAFLGETNRPPGGKRALKEMLDYCGVGRDDKVLDVGCNTGFCTFETATVKRSNVIGLDLSEEMIAMANQFRSQYDQATQRRVKFMVGNAKELPFEDNSFDFVFSGGSTFFVDDILAAVKEYRRVTKPWSFVGEMNFFYDQAPPKTLVTKVEDVLGFPITVFEKDDWVKIYTAADLEIYDCLEGQIEEVPRERIVEYVNALLGKQSDQVREASIERLTDIMEVFNENHRYLARGTFILRKRTIPEEPYLFAP